MPPDGCIPPYEITMPEALPPDRSLTGTRATFPDEDHSFWSFAMSDLICIAIAFFGFGLAVLYARACDQL